MPFCIFGECYLDGGNSALVIGLQSRPTLRPQKHYFERHFGASKMASTKARLLKHDFPVDGAKLPQKVSRDMGCRSDSIAISRDMGPLSSGPFQRTMSSPP